MDQEPQGSGNLPDSDQARRATANQQEDNRPKRSKPTQILPTPRIAFEKQLDILRAYAALSGMDRRSVKPSDVASLVGMNEQTVSLSHAFFLAIGCLERDEGGFIPSDGPLQYLQAYEWDSESAAYKLGPILRQAWFAQALIPQLQYGPMNETKAMRTLGEAAAAGPEYKNQIKFLLQYLEMTGIIERENGTIRLTKPTQEVIPANHTEDKPDEDEEKTAQDNSSDHITPVQQVVIQEPENLIRFQVAINLDMREIAKMSPDRIAAFFNGIAETMKAKRIMEGRQEE